MPNYACHKHHLHWLGAHYLNKVSCEISDSSLQDFWAKVEKVQKTHTLYIIMLINPSLYVSLEKVIFDLHITIYRVQPV